MPNSTLHVVLTALQQIVQLVLGTANHNLVIWLWTIGQAITIPHAWLSYFLALLNLQLSRWRVDGTFVQNVSILYHTIPSHLN
jgi:hypothetical protein